MTSWRLILSKVKSSVSVSSSLVACGKHFLISETVASGASSAASSASMFCMDVMKHASALSASSGAALCTTIRRASSPGVLGMSPCTPRRCPCAVRRQPVFPRWATLQALQNHPSVQLGHVTAWRAQVGFRQVPQRLAAGLTQPASLQVSCLSGRAAVHPKLQQNTRTGRRAVPDPRLSSGFLTVSSAGSFLRYQVQERMLWITSVYW